MTPLLAIRSISDTVSLSACLRGREVVAVDGRADALERVAKT